MTQQGDATARNPTGPAGAGSSESRPSFLGGYSGGGASSSNTNSDRQAAGSSQEGGSGGKQNQWPSLVNVRQVITAFILETVSTSRPLRNKLNDVILRLWGQYLGLVNAYPLLTAFVSCLVFFSSGPIVVFACVTGVSLGILVGVAAVIIIVIQSIVVAISGAILLFILGTIFVLTVFTFFWLVAGYMGYKFISNLLVSFKEHQLQTAASSSSGPTSSATWARHAGAPDEKQIRAHLERFQSENASSDKLVPEI